MHERSARVLAREISMKLSEAGIPTYPASLRDGFVFMVVGKGEDRVLVWIRTSPITRKAITLSKKIISKYQHKDLIILEFYEQADFNEPEAHIEKVSNVDEAVKCIRKYLF